jgi:hypothetical protein
MCQVPPVWAYLTISPVRVSVFIHTSTATMSRLDYIFRRWLLDVPGVPYFSVLAAGIPRPPDIAAIRTSCSDVKEFHRGFLNDEHGDAIFLGGGSGWLMSRAFVALHGLKRYSLRWNVPRALHFQDDTTETIIVRHVLPNISAWSDPLWSERCLNCQGSRWRQSDFSTLERCPDTQTYPMNALVSFHPGTDPQSKIAGKMVGWYPEDVRFYHPVKTGAISVCRGTGPRDGPTIEVLRAQALHVTTDMLKINEPYSVAGVWLV